MFFNLRTLKMGIIYLTPSTKCDTIGGTGRNRKGARDAKDFKTT